VASREAPELLAWRALVNVLREVGTGAIAALTAWTGVPPGQAANRDVAVLNRVDRDT
jgi:hypothetical protein